ncbi:MAG: hypothetical protein HUJ26_20805 [Planctomycetaceae bacterium]|nr:hypothetical protein [Planctomycetaceae bacterium]
MFHRITFALTIMCASSASLFAADGVVLFPDYKPDSQHVYDVEVAVNQTLTLNGSDIDTATNNFEERSVNVVEKTDTATTLAIKSNRLQFDLTMPGGVNVSFDSENPDREPAVPQLKPLIEMLKVASGMTTKVKLDSSANVEKLTLEAEGLDALPEALQTYLSEDRLKPQLNQEFQRLPRDAVKPGDTWERTEIFDAGQGQYFSYTTTYKYEGTVEENGQTYDKVTATYKNPKFDIEAGSTLPLSVKSSDLDMSKSTSTMLSAPNRGGLVKSNSKMQIVGKIVFLGPAQNELPGELDLTITTKLNRKSE